MARARSTRVETVHPDDLAAFNGDRSDAEQLRRWVEARAEWSTRTGDPLPRIGALTRAAMRSHGIEVR